MSQATAVSTAAAAPAAAPRTAQVAAGPGTSGAAVHSTPRRLRRLSLTLIVVSIAFGLLAALTFALLASALGRASASTAQLIRVQQIQTNLLAADATATNAFLVGGLEPPAQRQAYDDAITAATQGITDAAEAEPADEQALSALNEQLVNYVALVEDARSSNRQGFPVGAQYQRIASADLRADAMPVLDNLVAANSARAQSQMVSWQIVLLIAAGLGAVLALVFAQTWLARQFRRRFNPAVVAATAVIVVAWLVGLIAVGATGAAVGGIQRGAFADVNSVATARIQAYDAKSNESLTLIARGSGAAFEQAWQKSSAAVTDQLGDQPAGLRTSWTAYTRVHQQIRQFDDSGQWDKAVALATGSGADSANKTFGAFDEASTDRLGQVTVQTEQGLGGSRFGLVVGAVLSLLAGLAAAVLARRGLDARLREYR